MSSNVIVRAFGSLQKTMGGARNNCLQVDTDGPIDLQEVIRKLKIPIDLVQLVMVNHRAVKPSHQVQPGDQVALFPKEYPFFSDWNDYRIKP